jgi:hypothetical protein
VQASLDVVGQFSDDLPGREAFVAQRFCHLPAKLFQARGSADWRAIKVIYVAA